MLNAVTEAGNELEDMSSEEYRKWIFNLGRKPRKTHTGGQIIYGADGKNANGMNTYRIIYRTPIYTAMAGSAPKATGRYYERGLVIIGRNLGEYILLKNSDKMIKNDKNIMPIDLNSKQNFAGMDKLGSINMKTFWVAAGSGAGVALIANGLSAKRPLLWGIAGAVVGGILYSMNNNKSSAKSGSDDEKSNAEGCPKGKCLSYYGYCVKCGSAGTNPRMAGLFPAVRVTRRGRVRRMPRAEFLRREHGQDSSGCYVLIGGMKYYYDCAYQPN